MQKVILIVTFVIAAVFLARTLKERSTEQAEFERHEALVAAANECLDASQWKCAEDAINALLKDSPTDQNLLTHMAGILLEQERYEDCLNWVSSLDFSNKDLEYLSKKATSLIREMNELSIESSAHFRLEFEGHPSRTDVIEALTVLEVAYDSLCHLFDFYPENKMPVVLYEERSYQGVGPRPDWVAASFDGKLRIPINLMRNRDWYRPILFHELTHSFIRAMARNSIPLWLNEGIAQVVDASKTDKERPNGAKPTIQELSSPFVEVKNREKAELLYWYSEAMTHRLLLINNDFHILKQALTEISKTRNVDSSLEKFYKVTSEELLKGL